LVIHSNTVLTHSISGELLQPVSGRYPQIQQFFRSVEHDELS